MEKSSSDPMINKNSVDIKIAPPLNFSSPNSLNPRSELFVLDGLRGLAALYVMMHHSRMLLSQPYMAFLKNRGQYNFTEKILVYLTSGFRFGHEAVIFFFVLSGFVIHIKQAQSKNKKPDRRFNLANYLLKRVLRIYPTLILCLLVTWICDFSVTQINHQPLGSAGTYTLQSFFETFFLIPAGHLWGSNLPIWSLRHEWFFYLTYPILLFLDKIHPIVAFSVCLILHLTYLNNITIPIIDQAAYTLLIWWTGALLAEAYVQKQKVLLSIFVILLFPGLIFSILIATGPIHDLSCGLLFAGIITILLSNKAPFLNRVLIQFRSIGYFSYSIYILHFPILVLLRGIIIRYHHQVPFNPWFELGAILFVLPITYGFYLLVEKPFLNVKASISK
jgi:peptidoglycan/LPS O-acetylase OafA/YrhL